MKKAILGILLSLLCLEPVFSQFDAQFSQYMFNPSAFNPAAVGEGDMIQAILQGRLQWVGMPNAGKTLVASINSPLKIGNGIHGVGFKFFKDVVGVFENTTGHLQYAYKKHIGVGVLSIGADMGFIQIGIKADSILARKITLGDYHDLETDPAIPQVNASGQSFDMNIGAYYSTEKFYTGISYSHLNSPVIEWTDNAGINLKGTLFLTGGYNFSLPDTKYVFKPSGLFKTNFTTMQIDLSTRLEYDNKYWGGLSYRFQDAVVIMAGLKLASGLSVGYSYDIPTSRVASGGSHEAVLIYSFEYVFAKRNSKYKSIRIL
ncbi:MAG TPA: type IX secretion system membrane protein PorP/SprF [Paludibacter sp.]|nr:type IX secretion system membrane protein PorP/SprF [Paludibacter sp.]